MARIQTMRRLLIGKDPLAIEVHFHNLTTLMHTYMAHIPTISGIDIALWDLAGKILNRPVVELLGGPFRDFIPMYSHGLGLNMLDPASCRDWVQRVRAQPEGFTAFKIGIDAVLGVPAARYADTLDSAQLRKVARAYMNVREAAGDELDEDALNAPFSQGWMALKRSTGASWRLSWLRPLTGGRARQSAGEPQALRKPRGSLTPPLWRDSGAGYRAPATERRPAPLAESC